MQYSQGSSAFQMTAAKVLDVIAGLPDCAGRAANTVSACLHSSRNGRCTLVIENSKVRVSIYIWIRLPRHKWPKSWSNIEDLVVLLERNLYGPPLADLLWRRQFENIQLELVWEEVPNWECLYVHRKQ